MIDALVVLAGVVLSMPLIAVVLVSVASRCEDHAWTLADPPAGVSQVAGRLIVGFYSEGMERLPRADGRRSELIS